MSNFDKFARLVHDRHALLSKSYEMYVVGEPAPPPAVEAVGKKAGKK